MKLTFWQQVSLLILALTIVSIIGIVAVSTTATTKRVEVITVEVTPETTATPEPTHTPDIKEILRREEYTVGEEEREIVNVSIIKETSLINPEVIYVEDNTLFEGEEVVLDGIHGRRVKTFKLTTSNFGKDQKELIREVVQEPINTIVKFGTKPFFKDKSGTKIGYTKMYNMIATAYSPTPENWGYQTASGNRNREGGVAVDPRIIPLGTKLYVKGLNGNSDYGYAIAWDTGGSIKGNKIDLFMEKESDCIQFGIQDVEIYILEDQSINVFERR